MIKDKMLTLRDALVRGIITVTQYNQELRELAIDTLKNEIKTDSVAHALKSNDKNAIQRAYAKFDCQSFMATNQKKMIYPIYKKVVSFSSENVFSKDFEISELPEAARQTIDSFLDYTNFTSKCKSLDEDVSGLGHGFIRLTTIDSENNSDKPKLIITIPNNVNVIDFKLDANGDLISYSEKIYLGAETVEILTFEGNTMFRKVFSVNKGEEKYLTPEEGDYEEIVVLPFSKMPVVMVNNRGTGQGDLDNALGLIDSLFETITQEAKHRALSKPRVMVDKTLLMQHETGGVVFPDGCDHFIATNPAGSPDGKPLLDLISFDFKPSDYKLAKDELLADIYTTIGYDKVSFNLETEVANTSGKALEVRKANTTNTIKSKQQAWLKPIQDILSLVLEYYGFNDEIKISFPPTMDNLATLLSSYQFAYANGMLTDDEVESYKAMLGIVSTR